MGLCSCQTREMLSCKIFGRAGTVLPPRAMRIDIAPIAGLPVEREGSEGTHGPNLEKRGGPNRPRINTKDLRVP
jgi:hypothetical protein